MRAIAVVELPTVIATTIPGRNWAAVRAVYMGLCLNREIMTGATMMSAWGGEGFGMRIIGAWAIVRLF